MIHLDKDRFTNAQTLLEPDGYGWKLHAHDICMGWAMLQDRWMGDIPAQMVMFFRMLYEKNMFSVDFIRAPITQHHAPT